jgi:hypothetical protein
MPIYTIAQYQVKPSAIEKVNAPLKSLSIMSRQTNRALESI